MRRNKTGGGPGTNQYGVRGQSRRIDVAPALPTPKAPIPGPIQRAIDQVVACWLSGIWIDPKLSAHLSSPLLDTGRLARLLGELDKKAETPAMNKATQMWRDLLRNPNMDEQVIAAYQNEYKSLPYSCSTMLTSVMTRDQAEAFHRGRLRRSDIHNEDADWQQLLRHPEITDADYWELLQLAYENEDCLECYDAGALQAIAAGRLEQYLPQLVRRILYTTNDKDSAGAMLVQHPALQVDVWDEVIQGPKREIVMPHILLMGDWRFHRKEIDWAQQSLPTLMVSVRKTWDPDFIETAVTQVISRQDAEPHQASEVFLKVIENKRSRPDDVQAAIQGILHCGVPEHIIMLANHERVPDHIKAIAALSDG